MNPDSIPPLLRGIGLSIVLAGTLIGLIAARSGLKPHALTPGVPRAENKSDPKPLSAELDEHHEDSGEENIAEEMLENLWFEWLGIIGSGVVAASFYAEWFIRKDKKT